jgi:hypothetical protein
VSQDMIPPVELTGPEAEALISLLRTITGWLEDAARPAAGASRDLADQVARVTAILRLRQWTGGYRQMTGEPR